MTKIVIKVELSSHKLKVKAMEIASVTDGVTSIAVGEGKDQVVVIGERVDPVKLTRTIRKKVSRNAILILVEEVKPKKDDPEPSVPLPYPYQYYPPLAYTYYSI
ncbi:heavy metal-associated isoprenylated plant protein 47-like isoform X2 [Rhododendron vialii]|uniref:heavy metal-associated isoprenylated plant protein 47-like isoform X2 n=1 Tax=Rhododendron vialii TaxID=182163 RepID=UPI00265E5AAE|nr:heavy metal-associated isoprenylated plant protein 47-like isoform X2 [Rhododendron vialii]